MQDELKKQLFFVFSGLEHAGKKRTLVAVQHQRNAYVFLCP